MAVPTPIKEDKTPDLEPVENADAIVNMDAVILAVAHDELKKLEKSEADKMFGSGKKDLLDVKGILNP